MENDDQRNRGPKHETYPLRVVDETKRGLGEIREDRGLLDTLRELDIVLSRDTDGPTTSRTARNYRKGRSGERTSQNCIFTG